MTTDAELDSPTWGAADRVGTHWESCWRTGGPRHYACAVAEADRQRARADAAEAKLAAVPAFAMLHLLSAFIDVRWDDIANSMISVSQWLAQHQEPHP